MKKVLSLVLVLIVAISAMAGVEASPTRLDNTRSLGMGRAYTANGLDRVGVFFYNPAAIQNVDFSKATLFNFTVSGSMDWKDIYDVIYDLADDSTLVFDPVAGDAASLANTYNSVEKVRTQVNSLYNVNGSAFFQELGNWTNNGFGFAFFAKAGIDFGVNKTKAGDFLTATDISLISVGAEIIDKGIDPNVNPALALAQDGTDDVTGVDYFTANTEFPGLDIKNYIDLGVMATKGFTKELDKKYAGSDEYARLDYGVSAKMIWRSNLVDVNNKTIDGISAGAADFTANEDVDARFDTIEKTRVGFDVGALLHTKDKMNTRFGVSIMDIVSSDFGDNFDAPDPQINLGVALRPFIKAENILMRKVDVAVDFQDIANSDKDFDQQFKLGVEGRTTSMLTWRVGYSDKNPSVGVDFRVGKLGSMTIAHYYDLIDRFGREFETENWAIQFKAIF